MGEIALLIFTITAAVAVVSPEVLHDSVGVAARHPRRASVVLRSLTRCLGGASQLCSEVGGLASSSLEVSEGGTAP